MFLSEGRERGEREGGKKRLEPKEFKGNDQRIQKKIKGRSRDYSEVEGTIPPHVQRFPTFSQREVSKTRKVLAGESKKERKRGRDSSSPY